MLLACSSFFFFSSWTQPNQHSCKCLITEKKKEYQLAMLSGAPPIFAAFSASSCSSLGLPSWLSYHPGNLVVSEFTYAILTLGAMELWRKTNKPGSKSSWHYLGFPLRLVLPFAGQNQGVAVFHALAAKAPISSKAHTQGTTDDTSIGGLRPGANQQMTRVYIEKKNRS